MAKPSNVGQWDSTLVNVVEPTTEKTVGWAPGQVPTAQTFNWFQSTAYLWHKYVNDDTMGAGGIVDTLLTRTVTSASPYIAIVNAGTGKGLTATGGETGVTGVATGAGVAAGTNVYGGIFTATRTTGLSNNYGIRGECISSGTGERTGVFGLGITYGVSGEASGGSGVGVYGAANMGTGVKGYDDGDGNGVEGYVSGTGRAVWGHNASDGFGVLGESTLGSGVRGTASATLQGGVVGYNAHATGYGVYGNSSAGHGVHSVSSTGVGVYATTGGTKAVFGESTGSTTATDYYGLYGVAIGAGTGARVGVYGEGKQYGIKGLCSGSGYGGYFSGDGGVAGFSGSTTRSGVYGQCTSSAPGVQGESASGYGVSGVSTSGVGVHGVSSTGVGGQFVGNATRCPINIGALSGAPSAFADGDIYLDSSLGKLRFYWSGSWHTVTSV